MTDPRQGKDPESQIGARLADLRTERHLSQQQLAERMKTLGGRYENWRQSTIYKIEQGKRPLRVNEVFDLAAVLDVPAHFLLGPMLAGLDAEALDAKIAETEHLLKAAERKYDMAHGQLREADTARSWAETQEREAAGRAIMLRAMLNALLQEREQVVRG